MAQPPPYSPQTEFLTYQAQQAWFPGQNLDVEFNAIDTSIAAIETNLALLQEDDGTLAHGVVDFAQLSTTLATALQAAGVVVPISTVLTQENSWTKRQAFTLGLTADMSGSDYLQLYAYGGATGAAGLFEGNGVTSIGVSACGRTSTNTTPGQVAAGLLAFGFNDKVSGTLYDNWGIYCENRRYPNAGDAAGMELDITELGTSAQTDCYVQAYAGGVNLTAGIYLQSGGGGTNYYNPATGLNELTPKPASVALAIGNNGATFRTGIQFNYNAIEGNDGHSDGQLGPAIIMPRSDAIIWQYCNNTTGFPAACGFNNIGAYVQSVVKSADNVQKLIFQDGNSGMGLFNASTIPMFEVGVSGTYVNGLFIAPSTTADPSSVTLQANGTDSNITLALVPKGTAKVAVTGSLTVSAAVISAAAAIGTSPAAGFNTSIRSADGSGTQVLFAGSTKGLRVYQNAGGSIIEGVDVTGAASFQPLTVGGSALLFTGSGVGKLDYNIANASAWTFAAPMFITGDVSITGNENISGVYKVASTQVVGARATGWTVATGTPQRSTFTTGGVTLAQLAGVVMALEQDLIAHGLIGT